MVFPEYEYVHTEKVQLIEIKIKKVNQLFNSFDPSPFLEKDLDDDAFEYIVSSVGEHNLRVKQRIVIHLPKNQKSKISEEEIRRAIHHYFEYKEMLAEKSIKLKIQEGQMSLVIGCVFLTACLLLRQIIISDVENIAVNIIAEGLIIGGWVAMWKPISELLYEWWPLRKEKKIFNKIANMEIEIRYI